MGANLDGKTLHVANVLAFLYGVSKSTTFKLRPARFREFGVNRSTVSVLLKRIESVGPIKIERKPRSTQTVTILWDEQLR